MILVNKWNPDFDVNQLKSQEQDNFPDNVSVWSTQTYFSWLFWSYLDKFSLELNIIDYWINARNSDDIVFKREFLKQALKTLWFQDWDILSNISRWIWIPLKEFFSEFRFISWYLSFQQENEFLLNLKIDILLLFFLKWDIYSELQEIEDFVKWDFQELMLRIDLWVYDLFSKDEIYILSWLSNSLKYFKNAIPQKAKDFINWYLEDDITNKLIAQFKFFREKRDIFVKKTKIFTQSISDFEAKKQELFSTINNLNSSHNSIIFYFYSLPWRKSHYLVYQESAFYVEDNSDNFSVFNSDMDWFMLKIEELFSDYNVVLSDWWIYSCSVLQQNWNPSLSPSPLWNIGNDNFLYEIEKAA